MPTIRKRKSRWQAQVRVKDKHALTKSFDRYQGAVSWGADHFLANFAVVGLGGGVM